MWGSRVMVVVMSWAFGCAEAGGGGEVISGDTDEVRPPADTGVIDTSASDTGRDSEVGPEVCAPSCANRVCGPDGCGGVCGTCESGTCVDGACRLDCPDMAACVLRCNDLACAERCLARGTAAGQALMQPLVACVLERCQAMGDGPGCVLEAVGGECLDAYLECVPSATPCGLCPAGTECGSDPFFPAQCVGAGCPGELGPEGECRPGETTIWCDMGRTLALDCDYLYGEVCAWTAGDFWGCTPPCTPSCAGRECGSDGCGGSCGSCDDGERCLEGRCLAVAEYGESCQSSTDGSTCADGMYCMVAARQPGFCTVLCDASHPCPAYQGPSGPLAASCYSIGGLAYCFWECGVGQACPSGLACHDWGGLLLCLPPL